jgi:hypothetical protein
MSKYDTARTGEQMERHEIDVVVIGTEPPCPRCDLLSRFVEEIAAESSVAVRVRHCAFDAPDAIVLGQRVGREVGTAKDVAKAGDIGMDWDAVFGLINRKRLEAGPDCRAADAWTSELDEMLSPCQKAADAVGYLMTPILVVDGTVKHHGSVPSRDKVRSWILG